MPFRFRRSIRLAPGIRLSLSRRGLSASVGGHINCQRAGYRALLHGGNGTAPALAAWDMGAWLFGAAVTLILLWWFGWL